MPNIPSYSARVSEIRRRLEIPPDVFHTELAKVALILGPVPVAVPPVVEPRPAAIQPEPTFQLVEGESDEDFSARQTAYPAQFIAIKDANERETNRYEAERFAFQSYKDYVATLDGYLSSIESHMRQVRTHERSPSPTPSPPRAKRRRVVQEAPAPGGRLKRNGKSIGKSKADVARDLAKSGPREKACAHCLAHGKICLPDPKGRGACSLCHKRKIRCAPPTPPVEIPPEVAADLHTLVGLFSKTSASLGNIESALTSRTINDQRHIKVLEDLATLIGERFPIRTQPQQQSGTASSTASSSVGPQGVADAYNSQFV